jgi:hypothetical protein
MGDDGRWGKERRPGAPSYRSYSVVVVEWIGFFMKSLSGSSVCHSKLKSLCYPWRVSGVYEAEARKEKCESRIRLG